MKYVIILVICFMIALFGTRKYKSYHSNLRHEAAVACVQDMKQYLYMDYVSVGWCFYHGYEGYLK